MTPFGTRLVSHPRTRPPRLGLAIGLALWLVTAMALPGAAAEDTAGDGHPTVVVTTEMLGWLVDELAGDGADVIVLMHGVDPHGWEPSARDVETILGADLVVANGLDLEEGLHDILEQVEASGVPLFAATDHITVREAGVGDRGATSTTKRATRTTRTPGATPTSGSTRWPCATSPSRSCRSSRRPA